MHCICVLTATKRIFQQYQQLVGPAAGKSVPKCELLVQVRVL